MKASHHSTVGKVPLKHRWLSSVSASSVLSLQVRAAVEKYPPYSAIFAKLSFGESQMLDKAFYEEEVKRLTLVYDQQVREDWIKVSTLSLLYDGEQYCFAMSFYIHKASLQSSECPFRVDIPKTVCSICVRTQ